MQTCFPGGYVQPGGVHTVSVKWKSWHVGWWEEMVDRKRTGAAECKQDQGKPLCLSALFLEDKVGMLWEQERAVWDFRVYEACLCPQYYWSPGPTEGLSGADN